MAGDHGSHPLSRPAGNPDVDMTDQELDELVSVELMAAEQDPANLQLSWSSPFNGPVLQLGAAPAQSPGAGYQVTPDQLRGWITRLQDVIAAVKRYEQDIFTIENVTSPAADSGSTTQALQTRSSGAALRQSADAISRYAQQQVSHMQAALQRYEQAEESTSDAMKRLGSDT